MAEIGYVGLRPSTGGLLGGVDDMGAFPWTYTAQLGEHVLEISL